MIPTSVDIITGTRPNLVKISPLINAMRQNNSFEVRYVHTNQHQIATMSENVRESLSIRKPDLQFEHLDGGEIEQITHIMKCYSDVLTRNPPQFTIVIGDVSSTLSCALASVKHQIELVHLEAGLRSFDRTMPEEVNRVIVDSIANVLLTPTREATQNLINEGKNPSQISFVGNIMIDTIFQHQETIKKRQFSKSLNLNKNEFIVATIHRAGNTDNKEKLFEIFSNLLELSKIMKIVIPAHPRLANSLNRFEMNSMLNNKNIIFLEPLDYIEFHSLINDSTLVVTDSGGIQEETSFYGIPCLTYRENTERPITLTEGTNVLVSNEDFMEKAIISLTSTMPKKERKIEYWDGGVTSRIIKELEERFVN